MGGFRGQEVDIDCHKIEESSWKGKEDIAKEMNAGDCFCGLKWVKGLKWVENANCEVPIPTSAATGSKKRPNDLPDDHYSFASGTNYMSDVLSTAVFNFPIVCIGGHPVKS